MFEDYKMSHLIHYLKPVRSLLGPLLESPAPPEPCTGITTVEHLLKRKIGQNRRAPERTKEKEEKRNIQHHNTQHNQLVFVDANQLPCCSD